MTNSRIGKAGSSNLTIEFSLLGLLALLWGSSYLFIKIAVASIPPLTLMAFRVMVAALLLLMVIKYRRLTLPKDKSHWKMFFIQAFFNSIGAWTLLAWGQQYVDSGLATVLNSTSPIFVILITLFFFESGNIKKIGVLKILGAVSGLVGIVLIVGVEAVTNIGQQLTAQLAVLGGAFLYALAALYGKRFSHLSPTVTATCIMICASIVMVPCALIFDEPWTISLSTDAIIAAIILSIFCTAMALLIYFRLIQTLGPVGVASQAYLRVGVGVALGVLILGEPLTATLVTGLIFIVSGVVLINRNKKTE